MFVHREICLRTVTGACPAEMIPVKVCVAPGSDAAVAANTSFGMLMLYYAVEIRFLRTTQHSPLHYHEPGCRTFSSPGARHVGGSKARPGMSICI